MNNGLETKNIALWCSLTIMSRKLDIFHRQMVSEWMVSFSCQLSRARTLPIFHVNIIKSHQYDVQAGQYDVQWKFRYFLWSI
jgi:hypothetical protein